MDVAIEDVYIGNIGCNSVEAPTLKRLDFSLKDEVADLHDLYVPDAYFSTDALYKM